ncbi:hypothetical protein Va1_203 [Vibrio phage Va1]|nr:hypothetical protein Va1_203 [Vibrio phage Va1]
MFILANDVVVNLENVSNVNLVPNRNRIVFNMNYSIQMKHYGHKSLISDYVYWDAKDSNEYTRNLIKLKENEHFQREFFAKPKNDGFINVNEISSIKFLEDSRRIIFNLSHQVTFRDKSKNESLTSEFVYVDIGSKEAYEDYKELLLIELGL